MTNLDEILKQKAQLDKLLRDRAIMVKALKIIATCSHYVAQGTAQTALEQVGEKEKEDIE